MSAAPEKAAHNNKNNRMIAGKPTARDIVKLANCQTLKTNNAPINAHVAFKPLKINALFTALPIHLISPSTLVNAKKYQ